MWFVGASGVGKTTVASQLQSALERRGTHTAFVDADQLRNVAGVSATEDELIADGLRAIVPVFEQAGAEVLVVSGIVDDDAQLARLLPGATRADVLVVHLDAADQTVVDRIVRRRWNVHLADESVDYAREFDRGWVDVSVDTTAQSPAAVAAALLDRVEQLPERLPAGRRSMPMVQPSVGAVLTVVTGAGGVGLSTAGFMSFLQGMGRGERVGYVDSHQLGFIGVDLRSPGLAELKATNSVAIAVVMAQHGVEQVIITADPATSRSLVAIADPARVVWLDASDPVIEARHRSRAAGGGPPLAGDHRLGLDEDGIRSGVAAALLEARDESIRPHGHVVIETDDASADQVASQITAVRRS